jgi:hypothetical protein
VRLEKEIKINQDFFEPMKNNQVKKGPIVIRRNKHVGGYLPKNRQHRHKVTKTFAPGNLVIHNSRFASW